MSSSMDSNQFERSSFDDSMVDSITQDDEIMDVSHDALRTLGCQVEKMRNRKQQLVSLTNRNPDNAIPSDYESASDFEMGNEDICDTDSEWSESEVLSLGVRYQPSVKRNRLSDTSDSEWDDHLPLATLKGKSLSANEEASTSTKSTASTTGETASQPSTSGMTTVGSPDGVIDENETTTSAPVQSALEEDNETERNKPSRKRQRQPEKWKRNALKKLRNSGSAYVGFTGKEVSAKKMGPGCGDKCSKKCYLNFDTDEREKIFSNYWKSGDINIQRQFIVSCVTKATPDRVRTKNPDSRRKSTLKYSFLNRDAKRLSVCRCFFLDTLDIKQDVVYGALNKTEDGGIVSVEDRGAHQNHKTVGDDIVEGIRSHIQSFPTLPSHYCRKDTSKLYLQEGLNVATMYRMYTESQEAIGKPYAKESKYRDIFNREFNLGFFVPKKDQCDQCVGFDATPSPSQEEKDKHADHIFRKEKARKYKQTIKEQAAVDPSTVAACFDLQKVLLCPHGQASSFYYKRKLALYNLTFFDIGTDDVQCYLWPEHVSSRGANQIASCLWDYIQTHASNGKEVFNFISDNCAGQNRNRIVAAMFWFTLNNVPTIKKIEHGFLEVGHTQNENDSVHAQISKVVKRIPVYTPEKWATVIRGARKNKSPYLVKEMMPENFMDFKALSRKVRNLEYDDDGQKVNWTKIRAMIFEREDRHAMKIVYDQSTHRVDLMRRKRKSEDLIEGTELETLKEPTGIKEEKKTDLLSLCKSNLIPPAHHLFLKTYRFLSHRCLIVLTTLSPEENVNRFIDENKV